MIAEEDESARRAARREFVRRNHPDRGGDVRNFVEGLAGFDRPPPVVTSRSAPVTVVRTRSVSRTLVRAIREARRRIEKRPARRLL